MAFDLDWIKANNPIADIVCRAVQMRANGRELVGLCPFHGERTPSFTVTPEKGLFKCFGCDAQGDVIDFVQKLHNVDLPEACEILGGEREPPALAARRFEPPEPVDIYAGLVPQPVDGLPAVGEPLRCWNPKRAKFSIYRPLLVHPYRLDNSAILGVVIRIEIEGKKLTPQLRYVALPDGELTWSLMPFEKPRPLYRLDEIATSSDTVLLVEGEKCVDAAVALLARTVTTWPGGTNGAAHADWRPLTGRAVVVWGDADQEGENAVHGHTDGQGRAHQGIVHHLHAIGAKSVHVVPWNREKPKGWDIADAVEAGWTAEQVTAYARTAVAYPAAASAPGDGDPGWEPPPRDESRAGAQRSRRRQDGKIEWPAPVDFMAEDVFGAPILEERHVPAALWAFVKDVAERMGVDPTGVALSSLVCSASVVNEKWRLQPRRHDYTYTEGARLWGAILGPPSTIKTAQISECSRPLDELEVQARKRHAEEMRAYEAALAEHKRALKAKEETTEPRMPKLQRFLVEDATIEALSEVLRDKDDPKGRQYAPAGKALVRQDELSEWFANQDRYKGGGGSDRGAYLRLFNGQRFTLDRVMRGSFSISSWSACIIGGCQPGPIQKIARDTADDGLLQRFIWCVSAGQRIGMDRAPDQTAIRRYRDLFPALVVLEPSRDVGTDRISPIVLHRDAHTVREDVEAVARAMMAMPDTSKRLQAAFGKWGGIFMRLVLTFHMIEVADARAQGDIGPPIGVVPVEVVERVAGFMIDIVLPHQLRAEALMFSTVQTGHAQWVAGFILAKGHKRVTRTDITRAYGQLRAPEAAQELSAVMASLVTVGWLEPEEATNLAKGTHAWAVNPQVHVLFADRAARERSARADIQERAAKDLATLLNKRRTKGSQA